MSTLSNSGGGVTTETWNPTPEMTSEETVRKHLSRHINELTTEISKLKVAVTKLDDLRVQLDRADRALAAFNATYPDETTAALDEFACPDCPRRFSSKRGLSRHEGSAHPPIGYPMPTLDEVSG